MNLEDMSDQEKSVMLAKAMGWEIVPHPIYSDDSPLFKIPNSKEWGWELDDNFYDQMNMALAWRVLNWLGIWDQNSQWTQYTQFWGWWDQNDLWLTSPADAQRLWLDKILSLAIEAGIVEPVDSP